MDDLRQAALKQALEALEQSETTVPYEGFGMARREAERKHQAAITALKAALAEPVQSAATNIGCLGMPVNTPVTPPQRKPLTQEEIAAEWRKASECAGKSEGAVTTSQFVEMFARGVEAKHGIKESP